MSHDQTSLIPFNQHQQISPAKDVGASFSAMRLPIEWQRIKEEVDIGCENPGW